MGFGVMIVMIVMVVLIVMIVMIVMCFLLGWLGLLFYISTTRFASLMDGVGNEWVILRVHELVMTMLLITIIWIQEASPRYRYSKKNSMRSGLSVTIHLVLLMAKRSLE